MLSNDNLFKFIIAQESDTITIDTTLYKIQKKTSDENVQDQDLLKKIFKIKIVPVHD